MAGFNFGTTAKPVSNQSYLKAWNIYNNVEFGGISDPIEGTSKEGRKWRKWDMTFKCKEGIHVEYIFEPMDASASERRTIDNNKGGKTTFPSNIETLNLIIQQVVSVYMNDANKAKFQKLAATGKFNDIEFSKFIDILKKLLVNPKKPSEDYPIMLKLQGRNQDGHVYARLPNASISTNGNNAGEAWMERFLGPNLTLTNYERQQAKSTVNSQPTNMDAIDKETSPDDADGGGDDSELDNLVNSLDNDEDL